MDKGKISEPCTYPEGSRLARAVGFLQRPDFTSLPVGRYELGDGVYAMIQDATLKPWNEGLPEIHAKYLDVQAPISDPETIGVGPFVGARPADFDVEKDFALVDVPVEPLTLEPGAFAVLSPADAHKPCRTFGEPKTIRKVVIKVPVS